MTRKQIKEETARQYKTITDGMNSKFHKLIEMKSYFMKTGKVLPGNEKDWALFQINDKGLLWFEHRSVVRKLKKTARKCAINLLNKKETK